MPQSISSAIPLSCLTKAIDAICRCRTGAYGYSLSACTSCGQQHHIAHACGNRHGPQCQHQKAAQWLHHQLDKQLPGVYLITFTVPEALRPLCRSHPRLASQSLFSASSQALKRLAQAPRFIGTTLPGFPGLLHTRGRQLPYHPHIHSIVPGGGLSQDREAWLPSRTNFSVPVRALSPSYRALCKQEMRAAGQLAQIDPHVWTTYGTSTARPIPMAPPLHIPGALCLQSCHLQPAHRRLRRSASSPSPTENQAVLVRAPPASTSLSLCAASSNMSCRGLHEGATLRLYERQLSHQNRHHPTDDHLANRRHPGAASRHRHHTGAGDLSQLWRTAHRPEPRLALAPGHLRYGLSSRPGHSTDVVHSTLESDRRRDFCVRSAGQLLQDTWGRLPTAPHHPYGISKYCPQGTIQARSSRILPHAPPAL